MRTTNETFSSLMIFCLFLLVTTTTAKAEDAGYPVRISSVENRQVTRSVSTYGVLAPKIEDLSFRIGGRIASFAATEGLTVDEGQVLAELEKRDAKDALNKTRVEYDQATRQFERLQKLAADRLIQAAQLDNAKDTLEKANIALQQAELELERSTLRAPAKGVILREYLQSRTTIAAGTPIYSFRDISGSWITQVELTDRNAFAFGPGTKAVARFAPYPGEEFEGELTKQAGVADENDGLYTVEVTIATHGRELRPGMVVEIDLTHQSEQPYTIVPLDSLVDLRGNKGVIYLLDEAGETVEERHVHIMTHTGDSVALVEAIKTGRSIVVRGQQNLRDHAHVDVL